MPETKAQMFLRAKQALRLHPELTDEELAERASIPRALLSEVCRAARADLAADA